MFENQLSDVCCSSAHKTQQFNPTRVLATLWASAHGCPKAPTQNHCLKRHGIRWIPAGNKGTCAAKRFTLCFVEFFVVSIWVSIYPSMHACSYLHTTSGISPPFTTKQYKTNKLRSSKVSHKLMCMYIYMYMYLYIICVCIYIYLYGGVHQWGYS